MVKGNEKSGRLARALMETAEDMRRAGIMDDAACEKITLRHLGTSRGRRIAPLTGNDIREMRRKAHMSQAVFAYHLNLTVGYISQLEREVKRPTGAALALLNLIRNKGIEAIL